MKLSKLVLIAALFLGTSSAIAGSMSAKQEECVRQAQHYGDGAFGAYEGFARDPATEHFLALPERKKAEVLLHGQRGWDEVTKNKPITPDEIKQMIQDYYEVCLAGTDI